MYTLDEMRTFGWTETVICCHSINHKEQSNPSFRNTRHFGIKRHHHISAQDAPGHYMWQAQTEYWSPHAVYYKYGSLFVSLLFHVSSLTSGCLQLTTAFYNELTYVYMKRLLYSCWTGMIVNYNFIRSAKKHNAEIHITIRGQANLYFKSEIDVK